MCNPGARERLSRRSCRPLGCRTLLRWYADMGTHAWEHALSLHTRLPWERIRRARRPQRAARACEIPSRGAASSRPRRALRCRCAAQRDLVARSDRGTSRTMDWGVGKRRQGCAAPAQQPRVVGAGLLLSFFSDLRRAGAPLCRFTLFFSSAGRARCAWPSTTAARQQRSARGGARRLSTLC